ncbi:MAG: aspartate-semialdehyde dehydrogenase [Pseudomonadota bacterium]
MVDPDFEKAVQGYGLTTANILYRMPDHRSLVQEFIWQHHDLAPKFPELRAFLEFWTETLDGPIHSVQVAHKTLIAPQEWRTVSGEFRVH